MYMYNKYIHVSYIHTYLGLLLNFLIWNLILQHLSNKNEKLHVLSLFPMQLRSTYSTSSSDGTQFDSFVTDSHKPWGRSKKKSEKKKTKQL